MASNDNTANKVSIKRFEALEKAIINESNRRKVDAMFAELMVGPVEVPKSLSDEANYPQFVSGLSVPRYTESIDALMAVARKVLPEIAKVNFDYHANHVTATVRFTDKRGGYGNKDTAPLALMSAIAHLKRACDTGVWDV